VRWSEQDFADYEAKRLGPSPADPPFAVPADDAVMPITISVVGPPQGKGRARTFVKPGGHVGHYTPTATRDYEAMIRAAAQREMGNKAPWSQPVRFTMRAIFPIPASWSAKKRNAALTGGIWPAKKPDLDNILKAWKDALNGVVYVDDALVVRAEIEKRYGPQPLVVATVRLI
jgi:Holliday junction resolvase RusA-like endonuclease